jgi:hypothetical protein
MQSPCATSGDYFKSCQLAGEVHPAFGWASKTADLENIEEVPMLNPEFIGHISLHSTMVAPLTSHLQHSQLQPAAHSSDGATGQHVHNAKASGTS